MNKIRKKPHKILRLWLKSSVMMCQAWMTFLEIRKIKNKKQMLTNQIKEKA
jgi:hypothetical protein